MNFPRIAGKPAGYLANQLKNFRDGQRSYPPMNYLVATMRDDYLTELADNFAVQPVQQRGAIEPGPAGSAPGGLLVTQGDAARGIPACQQCHGERLTGLEPGIPGLIGLNSRYIAAQLVDDDAHGVAVYLKSLVQLKPIVTPAGDATAPAAAVVALGQRIYGAQCAECHRPDGRGMPTGYPPLAGNPSIQMDVSVNPLRMVLNGVYPPQTAGNARPYGMPPFAQVLTDEEVAAVVTYIRVSWGNHGSLVTPREANAMRLAPLLD